MTGTNLDAKQLAGFPVAARRRVLRRWLEACGLDVETLSFDAIERLDDLVRDCRGGRAVTLSRGWLVRRYGAELTLSMDRHGDYNLCSRAGNGVDPAGHSRRGFQPRSVGKRPRHGVVNNDARPALRGAASNISFSVRLTVPGETRLPEQGCIVSAFIGPGIVKEKSLVIGALPARASLSLRAWRKRRLVARSWKPGDRMQPLGMQGTKKLQDIFSDGKVPPTLRHKLPVIECQGEIVWIPGFRIAQGWEVRPDEATALQLAMEP